MTKESQAALTGGHKMEVTFNEEQLKKLIQEAVGTTPKPALEVSTMTVYQKYLDTHKLSTYTKSHYDDIVPRFSKFSPYFPTSNLIIEEYINNLTNLKTGKPSSFSTRKSQHNTIASLVMFAIQNYDIPDYSKKLKPPTDHRSKETILDERPSWNPEELIWIISQLEGLDKLIVCTLIDSGCRIGELGYAPDHPGLTRDRIFTDEEKIAIYGKTGFHKMHCSAELCEILAQQSSPNGAVFHTTRMPNGLSDKALQQRIWRTLTQIVKNGLKLGLFQSLSKTGAHTIRHSVASFLADTYGQPILIQQFLRHATTEMSMHYVHLSDERKNNLPSPLKLMGQQVVNDRRKAQQHLLITDGEQSTSLTISGQEVPTEYIEGEVDLSDDFFQKIPDNLTIKRVRLNRKEIEAIRAVSVFYTRQSSKIDPIPGILSRMLSHILQKSSSAASNDQP